MKGLTPGDLGVANDSFVSLDNLDYNTICSLLHTTNQKHEDFVITEHDKPIAAIISLEEYVKLSKAKEKLSENKLNTFLNQYEAELDTIL